MCIGVGIKQVSNVKQMLGKLTTLDSNNYPEMLGKTCIINAPPGFNMMFGMIKPFLDVRTRAKVEVSRACLWSRLLRSLRGKALSTLVVLKQN